MTQRPREPERRRDPGPRGAPRGVGRGRGPRPPRPHRRRRARARRLPRAGVRSAPSNGRGGSTQPSRGALPPRPRRRSDRGQGHPARLGLRHHLRLANPRGLPPAVRGDRGHAARGRRRDRPRQDQHGRVRDGLVDRAQRLQAHAQPLGPRVACPAARRAARPPRWPRAWSRWRSAPTPAARSASPRPCAASPGSSRPGAAPAATGSSPSRRRSTRWARSRATSRTWRSRRRCCAGTTRGTPPARPCPSPTSLSRCRAARAACVSASPAASSSEGVESETLARFDEALRSLRGRGRHDRRRRAAAPPARDRRLLPRRDRRGLEQPRALRRRSATAFGPRARPTCAGSTATRATTASGPRSSAASCSAPSRSRPATTTPTTCARSRCGR